MFTAFTTRPAGRSVLTTALVGLTAVALVGCAGGGSADSDGYGNFDYLAPNENAIIRDAITTLSANECAAANEAMPLEIETLPQADVNQRLVLLASQNSLPTTFIAPTAELRPGGVLGDDETVVNLEEKLTELGVMDSILPAAVSTVKNIYGGRFVSMPYQFNIEGIFYNKAMFADLGLDEPQTWTELMAAADAIEASGKQAFTIPGSQSWLITRHIGNYIFRDLGPDALIKVANGDAKITDPEYVAALEAVQAVGGYLGEGWSTMDLQTSVSQLLTGEVGMMYNGSWMLADINNPEINQLGADAIGFMPFPGVTGGAGSIDQYPANAGAATAFSTDKYNEGVDAWLTCIAENYGSSVMNEQGVISGFALNQPVDEVPPLTGQVQNIMAEVTETVTWFELAFQPRAAAAAGENAVPFMSGAMSAADFAATIQAAVEAEM